MWDMETWKSNDQLCSIDNNLIYYMLLSSKGLTYLFFVHNALRAKQVYCEYNEEEENEHFETGNTT
jgi:hypothetical protein